MNRLIAAFFLVSALAFGLAAQDIGWAAGKSIRDIRFDGLDRITRSELEGVVKPFVGKSLTEEDAADLINRLYALEYFDSVIPEYAPVAGNDAAVVILLSVSERPYLEDVVIRGNATQRTSDIMAEVLVKTGKPALRPKIIADEENIRRFYIKNGYADVKVESNLEPGKKPNGRILVFNVTEGVRTSVRKVLFTGLKFATEGSLKGLLKTAEQGLFNAGTFQEANLDLDIQAIVKYYRDNGYLDVRMVDVQKNIEYSAADKRNYLTVTFAIDEGEQYTFAGVKVAGSEIFSEEKLLSLFRLKPGAVANYSRITGDYQAIADLYYQNGYINNGISLDLQKDTANRSVFVAVNIVEKGRAYIEDIIIKGNKKTDTSVILRSLPFQFGDVFSSKRIREGLLNLTNLRFFTSVVPETPAGSEPGLYDLVLNVSEANTIDLRLGMSLTGSEGFPLSAFIRFADTNFLGKGMELSSEVSAGATEQRLTLGYSDPWLFGPNWGGSVNLSLSHALKSGIPVDMAGPVFEGRSGISVIPDPFDGHYVFGSDGGATAYNSANGASVKKGDAFPGVPTDAQISAYSLVTDYSYAGGLSGLGSASTMSYDTYDVSLGLSTGKRIRTPIGWFSFGVSGNFELNIVDYDASKYRPADLIIRQNYRQPMFVNSLGTRLSLDGRDITFDPTNGYYVGLGASMFGGVLAGTRHYIQTNAQLQGYLTFWDLPLEFGTLGTWNWRVVAALGSSLDVLFPQFFTYENGSDVSKNFVATGRMLYTNAMTVARGWPSVGNGEALWNNWFELRTTIVPQLLSLDAYFDAVRITGDRGDIFDFNAGTAQEGWMFGVGAGLRLLNPSLPLRLYVGKRFKVDAAGSVEWQKGNLGATSDPTSGVDLILAFSLMN